MTWANPEWFWALLILPVLAGLQGWRLWRGSTTRLLFSHTGLLDNLPGNWKSKFRWLPVFFQWVGLGLLITALARPQIENVTIERSAEGIDIVLVMDVSTSMLAEDLKPNRFIAAKEVAKNFIDKRISDRIGLVIFAGQSYTVVPPTLDYTLLKKMIDDVEMGRVEDGTAIGMGIATAINRLKESEAKSKIIILLTDGENNAGEIDPSTASDLAVTFGIKVYTIATGTKGTAPYPVQDPIFGKRYQQVEVNVDEEMMQEVAQRTGGRYFRATDTQGLQEIYDVIDALERSKVDEMIFTDYEDLYERWVLAGILCLAAAFLLDRMIFRTLDFA